MKLPFFHKNVMYIITIYAILYIIIKKPYFLAKGTKKMTDNEVYMLMGNRIRLRRKEMKINQNKLADQIQISRNHMSAIENGREKPGIDTLLKICTALKVTPDFILLGNIHPNNVPESILDSLRLCSYEDIILVRQFIELLINRNSKDWNEKHFY